MLQFEGMLFLFLKEETKSQLLSQSPVCLAFVLTWCPVRVDGESLFLYYLASCHHPGSGPGIWLWKVESQGNAGTWGTASPGKGLIPWLGPGFREICSCCLPSEAHWSLSLNLPQIRAIRPSDQGSVTLGCTLRKSMAGVRWFHQRLKPLFPSS